ncbi:MAG: NAD(P)/FAD-dependent oxidoreductase [Pseudonocardiaceae bacterium]
MTATADIVVIGAGIVGASIAQQLTRHDGGSVVICEQYWAGGQTATAQSGGMLRLHHTAECDIELAARSLPTYQRFGQAVGGYCGYMPSGFALLVGAEQVDAMSRNVDKARFLGCKIELLEPSQLTRLYPGLCLHGVAAAAYEPHGGYGNPAATTRDLLLAARSGGATVLGGVRAEQLLTCGERISGVRTNIGEVRATTVVLAGGAASARLASTVDLNLPIIAQPIGIALSRSGDGTGFQIPATIDDTIGNYFRPDGQPDMYFGVPCRPEPAPPWPDHALCAEDIELARAQLWHRVPALRQGHIVGTRCGVDGYTPDRHPLIGPAGPEGLYLATGMSGGGYKLAPAVGELVAKEIRTDAEQSLLAPYRPRRFADDKPIVAEFGYRWM